MDKLSIDALLLRRAARGYHYQILQRLGVSQSTLTRKLSGKIRLTLDDLNEVCAVIGRQPIDFIKQEIRDD